MEDVTVDPNGAYQLLSKLNIRKAFGPDGLNVRIFKECSYEIAQGTLPDDWRLANASPVFMKYGKYDASNYRPVSLFVLVFRHFF